MVKHKHRLIGIVVFALIEVAVLVLPLFDVLDAETAETIAKVLLGALTAVGVVDASIVERRRRDPAVPALSDDVRDGGEP